MNNRESPLYWSIPLGTWFWTRVRVSVFFPLIVIVLFVNFGLAVGGLLSGILFVSVLFHEFGHIYAARATGGLGDEILIWPLGGLAFVQPAGTFASKLLTAAAGPIVNLLLCAITLWPVVQSGHLAVALKPLVLPHVDLAQEFVQAIFVFTFTLNWLLLLINLIPVFPLDGGRMLQACLATRLGNETAADLSIKIGIFLAFVAMFAGLLIDNGIVLVFFGAFLLVLNMQESFQMRTGDTYDESFMGYDFSQGYTSLEKSSAEERRSRPGLLKRWRMKRRLEKQQQADRRDAEVAEQLDALLDKVHIHGIESLSEPEKRLLDRASARFRDKGKKGL